MYTASNITVDYGVWNHVAVTVDTANSNVTFYINNSNVYTYSNVELGILSNSNQNLLVAQSESGSNYFKGSLDHINIYDSVALSADAVNDLATFKVMQVDFDDTMTTSLKESSVYGETVTLSNSPTTTNFGFQVGNQAMVFDRNQQQAVVVSGASTEYLDMNRLTFSAWINPSDVSGDVPLLFKEGTFQFGLDGGKPYIGLPNLTP